MTRMHNPPQPGEVLADTVLGESGITVTELAKRLGVSRVALSRVVNGPLDGPDSDPSNKGVLDPADCRHADSGGSACVVSNCAGSLCR
jgi:hypothetical protein